MDSRILHLRWRLTGVALAALLGVFFWVPASSTEPLSPSQENEVPVALIQTALMSLGHYAGSLDGRFGPQTHAAIGSWQESAGLEVTGELTGDQQQTLIRESAATGLAEDRKRLETIATALEGFEQRLKSASDGIGSNSQALSDLGGRLDSELEKLDAVTLRLDTLGDQLKQDNEALKEHSSRIEDNSVKLYETLLGIDSAKKELTLMRRAYEQIRSAHAETQTQATAGDSDTDRLDPLLPLVLCLLVPLAVIVNQGGVHATAPAGTTEAKPVAWVLVAWFAGGVGFLLLGVGIMYGPSLGGVIGNPAQLLGGVMLAAPTDLPAGLLERLAPNLTLAGVVAVVVCSSAPQGLTNRGHFLVALVTGALVYPLFGHWITTPTDISAQSGWLAGSAFSCSAATTNVALLGGILAFSLASGLGLIRTRSLASSPPPIPSTMATMGAMLLWIAWIGVILTASTDCQPPAVLTLSLAGAAGGAAVGVLLVEGTTTRNDQWQNRLPFAVLAGIVAAPVGAQEATFVELAALGALTGVSASLLMRLVDARSMADIRLATALLVGGIFGTLAPAIVGPSGFLFLHSIDLLSPRLQGMGAALLLGLVAGRALAWPIDSARFLRTRT